MQTMPVVLNSGLSVKAKKQNPKICAITVQQNKFKKTKQNKTVLQKVQKLKKSLA